MGVTLRILLGKDTAEGRPPPQPPAVCEPVPARPSPSRAGHAPANHVATRGGNGLQLGARWLWVIAAAALLLTAAGSSGADEPEGDAADSSFEDTLEAGESSVELPRRSLVRWNEFDGPFTTLRFGAGFLYEIAAFSQDDESEQQFDLETEDKLRDFRFLFKGRLKTERPVTWYLSDNVRFELAYGYGTLDRFGLEGSTQFFQSRIQLLF